MPVWLHWSFLWRKLLPLGLIWGLIPKIRECALAQKPVVAGPRHALSLMREGKYRYVFSEIYILCVFFLKVKIHMKAGSPENSLWRARRYCVKMKCFPVNNLGGCQLYISQYEWKSKGEREVSICVCFRSLFWSVFVLKQNLRCL